MTAVKANLMATNVVPRVSRRSIASFVEKMQNNKVPKVIKIVMLGASCFAFLTLVVFIAWATQLNPLITVPAVLSAAYLSYVVAYWTILK
jgi:hypothetical protein